MLAVIGLHAMSASSTPLEGQYGSAFTAGTVEVAVAVQRDSALRTGSGEHPPFPMGGPPLQNLTDPGLSSRTWSGMRLAAVPWRQVRESGSSPRAPPTLDLR